MIVELKKDKKLNDIKHNQKYVVISIDFVVTEIKFRILNENGIPSLYDSKLFKIIDNRICTDYVYKEYSEESFELVPEKMSYSNFWDDFFNLENDAITIFKKRFPKYKDKLFY